MKTAFVYDKWFSSLGGGEVVAGHLALGLKKLGYQTTIITGLPTSSSKAKEVLKLDLTGINFVQSFNDQLLLNQITQGADIFINCSFWDYSTSSAKANYYYCFFPTPPKNNFVKNLLFQHITPYEITTDNQTIFYNLTPNKIYQLHFSLVLNEFSKTNLQKLDVHFQNAKVHDQQVTINHFQNKITYDFSYSTLTNSATLVVPHPIDLYHYPIQDKLFSIMRSGLFPPFGSLLKKFDQVLATSKYTQEWIKKYWKLDSPVLYPPVNPVSRKQVNKKNQILSVGRFFIASHNKKQEIMIAAFKQLVDNGLKGWELHLAGGLNHEPESQKYFQALQKDAAGYPVFFHLNQPRTVVEKLFVESKIYWHAAGHELDKNKYPERFEHFGITPVEGLSAGCIPIVYNGGGLVEVIEAANLNHDSHTFDSVSDSVTKTLVQIKNPTTIKYQHQYSIDKFYQNLEALITKNKLPVLPTKSQPSY